MSLRWIHENLEPPNVDEECSDIDDSCSEGSYDSDLMPAGGDDNSNNNNNGTARTKREMIRHTTTITFDKSG